MTAAPIAFDLDNDGATAPTPQAAASSENAGRRDGLVPVRLLPVGDFFATGNRQDTASAVVNINPELIVSYVAAVARRAVSDIKNGRVARDEREHDHAGDTTWQEHAVAWAREELEREDRTGFKKVWPAGDGPEKTLKDNAAFAAMAAKSRAAAAAPGGTPKACLHCAVHGATHDRARAGALLDILDRRGTDADWNCNPKSTDTQLISRLDGLQVSLEDLADLYGPNWATVILFAMRAGAADPVLVRQLSHGQSERPYIDRIFDDHRLTRQVLAACRLGSVVCPDRKEGHRTPGRLGSALGQVAAGEVVEWLDHLPAPPL